MDQIAQLPLMFIPAGNIHSPVEIAKLLSFMQPYL